MSKRTSCLAFLVCLVMATTASAAFVQMNEVRLDPYQYSMIGNNLIQSGSATLVSQYNSTLMQPGLGSPTWGELPALNDGVISASHPPNYLDIVLMDGLDETEGAYGPPPYQVFELNTTLTPLGYDLTEVAVVASWTGSPMGGDDPPTDSNNRTWQMWEIKYNLVGEGYAGTGELNHTLGAIQNYLEHNGGWHTTNVSLTDDTGTLVSGVSALQIKYLPNNQSGHGYGEGYNLTGYSEVMMAGTPTAAVWTGFGGTAWSTATGLNNWKSSGGTAIDYINGTHVTFNDTAAGTTADISAADVTPASVVFNNTAKNVAVQGSKGIVGSASLTKQGNGNVTLTSVNSYTGLTTVEAGTLQLGIGAQSPVLTGGGADIQNGKIVLDYTGGSSPAAAVKAALTASHVTGFASGQIRSSTATRALGLGWVDNTGASELTIAYTLYGDTNLDGSVDFTDLSKLLAGYSQPGDWAQGDFDYSGIVAFADLSKTLANYRLQAERLRLAWRPRRIIYNDDGWDVRPYTTPAELLALRVQQVTNTQVDSIAYCTGGGGTMWAHQPTPGAGEVLGQYVNESSPANAIYLRDGLIALKENYGTDPLAVVVDHAHQHDQEVFWSYRMNNAEDAFADYALSTRKRQHPEYLMGVPSDWSTYPVSDPRAWWSSEDFAVSAVRDYIYQIFNDVSNRYDVDGIELDFIRHPMFFRPNLDGLPATSAQTNMMTDMVRAIRAMTNWVSYQRGRPLLVSIRTPLTVEDSLAVGLDVSTYVQERLTDILVVGQDYAPLAVAGPLQDMVNLGHQYSVPVYALLNPSQESQYNTIEAWRGAAMNRWYWGADGIYTFNLFPTSPDQRFDELGSAETLKGLDKIYAVDHIIPENALGIFKASLVIPDRLPLTIAPNVVTTAKLPVGEDIVANTPEGQTVITTLCLDISSLVLGDELVLDLNGYSLTVPDPDQPLTSQPANAIYYLNIDPAWVQPGYNLIDIQLIPAMGAPSRTPVLDVLWLSVDYHLAAESQAVPEPGILVLLATGLIGFLAYAWFKPN